MKLIIDSMKNFMGDSAHLGLIYMIQILFDVLNNMYARDPIWHDGRLGMGHWGEVILRDMADPIHRTIK